VGCASFADGADPDNWTPAHNGATQAWEMLRSTEEAAYVALGMPGVLVRTPYGAGGEQAESFVFEELPPVERGVNASEDRARHEAYLWGHPALALAEALANAFLEDGWSMDPGAAMEIGGLPVHSFVEGPEGGPRRVKACAEAWLTERGASALREAGVTALLSIKGRDAVGVPGITPLGRGASGLGGRWT
jgi:type VI secretion system protein ImpC